MVEIPEERVHRNAHRLRPAQIPRRQIC